jgi:phospholipid/cholesterol/gamma-HCH transport system substrate-binding protein
MRGGLVPTLAGLATLIAIAAAIAFSVGAFRGSFTPSVPVTVLSPRAGLMMNNNARVTMRGVEVGKVASIEALPNGQAAVHLAMDPSQLHLIPANVQVEMSSPTVFGAKYVQMVPPPEPSPQPLHSGQVLDAQHVTVEINTVFDQLTAVLSKIEPAKLNETLGTLAKALNGRGQKLGNALVDLDEFFAKVNRSLPALSNDIAMAPGVFNAYADAAPDLIKTVANATRLSQTIVDEQHDLDAFLVSVIGLADVGNDVVGTNRQALTDVLHLLVPTTDLTNRYNQALTCGLGGLVPLAKAPPLPLPGVVVSVSFTLGTERYRYPQDLPKVAATGGPQCQLLPKVPMEAHPPFVVMDVGANPTQYGNQGILLNSDGLKQLLFGPIDGPPRNTAQIGQPG